MANKPARKAVTLDFENLLLSLMPASSPQMALLTKEKRRTVQNALQRMHESGLIYVREWQRSINGGPAVRVYAVRTEAMEADAPREQVIRRQTKCEQSVLSLLPATVQEITEKSGGGLHHVQTTVRQMYRRGEIRVCDWRPAPHGGPAVRVYGRIEYAGQKDAICTFRRLTRSQQRRRMMERDDNFLLREKARRDVKKLIKAGGDPMISLLFGKVRETA